MGTERDPLKKFHQLEDREDVQNNNTFSSEKESKFSVGAASGASNCWAVHGNYTESGKPLLACDPHITKSMFNLWESVHLEWKEGADKKPAFMAGASFVGTPAFSYARTEYAAFGCTAINPDTIDVFSETI